MKGIAAGVALLVVWGVIKPGWEASIDRQRRVIIHGADVPLTVGTRDLLGQELSLAILGGFRGLAATFSWISLTSAWEDKEWTRVRALADLATTIQPKMLLFWEQGAWHMAWNASIDAEKYAGFQNPSRARVESRKWIEAGIDMLERGLKVHPTRANLYLRMGEIYWQRLEDYPRAAEYYREAARQEDAPAYAERFVGYALEKAGQDREAYAYWKQVWPEAVARGDADRPPWRNVLSHIQDLEEKLEIPEQERIGNNK